MHDLSTDLFNEEISTLGAAKEQNEKIEKINERKYLKKQSMSQRKQKIKHRQITLLEYRKECKNAIKQYDKRTIIINAFVSKDILIKNVEADICYNQSQNLKKAKDKQQKWQALKIRTPDQNA